MIGVASLAKAVVDLLTGKLLDKVSGLAELYLKKEISNAEFRSRVEIEVQNTVRETEKAWAEVAARQYTEFQESVRQSPVVARAYAAVIVTQLFVLLWYQWGASAFLLITGTPWPSAGATVDWAYAILALCLGGGALYLRGNSAR
ncbi:MAG: hypothetical protein IOC86_05600 [Aestuariivirga sp.]|nr:hypothetical protein [Aestuariivirga sp.]